VAGICSVRRQENFPSPIPAKHLKLALIDKVVDNEEHFIVEKILNKIPVQKTTHRLRIPGTSMTT
jgi:hypothetical protein